MRRTLSLKPLVCAVTAAIACCATPRSTTAQQQTATASPWTSPFPPGNYRVRTDAETSRILRLEFSIADEAAAKSYRTDELPVWLIAGKPGTVPRVLEIDGEYVPADSPGGAGR